MRLLIIDRDPTFAASLAEKFRSRQVICDLANDLESAEHLLRTVDYVAIFLDPFPPHETDVSLIGQIRTAGFTHPLIVLSARDAPQLRIEALLSGADDYIPKSLSFAELCAHLEAILRRVAGSSGRYLELGQLAFDPATRELSASGMRIEATLRETQLLEILLRRKRRLVPRRLLEDHLFGFENSLGSNAVDVYVHRVRRKLERHSVAVGIKTVRGMGYMLTEVA